ncbi:hypothetical protein C0991_001273 [Blastosporella zonata]|nr:hypothetical protein C0991_001273 [Blastosporella zonata]
MQPTDSSVSGLIANVAQHIRLTCNTNITSEDISTHLLAGRPLSTITPQLAAIGALPASARQACLKAANDLRDACESSLRKTLLKAPTQEEATLINDVLHASDAQQTSIRSLLQDVYSTSVHTSASRQDAKGKKPVFNHGSPSKQIYDDSATDRSVGKWNSAPS